MRRETAGGFERDLQSYNEIRKRGTIIYDYMSFIRYEIVYFGR